MTTDFRLDHALNGLSDKEKKEFREYLDQNREDKTLKIILDYHRGDRIAYGLRGDNLVSYASDKDGKYVRHDAYDTNRFDVGYITVTGRELINFMKVLRKWLSKDTAVTKECTKQSYDSVLLAHSFGHGLVYLLEYVKLEDAINDYVETKELDNAEGIKVLFFNQSDMKTVTEEKKFKLV